MNLYKFLLVMLICLLLSNFLVLFFGGGEVLVYFIVWLVLIQEKNIIADGKRTSEECLYSVLTL